MCINVGIAQEQNDNVKVKNADKFIFENIEGEESKQILKGNVKMEHDTTFMYADTATIQGANMEAEGNIVIIETDSTFVFSDSLSYNSDSKDAKLFENVVLRSGAQELFTDRLFYNTETRIAIYRDTAILRNQRTQLTSKFGIYDVGEKYAQFRDQVVVVDSSFEIHADSLDYDTGLDKLIFIGPSYIFNEERKIYCEEGFYLINEGKAYFTKNAYLSEEDKISTADEITYSEKDSLLILQGNAQYKGSNETATADVIEFDDINEKLNLIGNAEYQKEDKLIQGPIINYDTEKEQLILEERSKLDEPGKSLIADFLDYNDLSNSGYAQGNVIWNDSIEASQLKSAQLYYRESDAYFKAIGDDSLNPILLQVDNGDSIFLSADTLFSEKIEVQLDSITTDSFKTFRAFFDVKLWKEDLRGIADSLYYSDLDSIYRLYGDPIIWTDSTEYKGDTIFLKMEEGKLKQIDAFKNGYIINMHNSKLYDQIKGKHITTYLKDDEAESMHVKGSAESIYFLKDGDDAFIGPNHTKCSRITFYFEDNEVQHVKFYDTPESVLTPIQQATRNELFLDAFDWQMDLMPVDFESIRLPSARKKAPSVSIPGPEVRDSTKLKDPFEKAVLEVLDKENKKK